MNKWQKRFFDLAKLVATWSKDPSSQVGAVIVDDKKRIVSVGFNGLPIGVKDTEERLNTREIKYELIVHAEANAILTAPKSVAGCTIYVHPYLPCSRCAGAIIQSGIKKVVVEDRPIPERWLNNFMLAKSILEEAGVEIEIVAQDEEAKN
ncbi:deoxycytidylate deaminase [Acetobacter sp. CAG:977]|mgnify:FL=1|nr:deoxycytidylate deaminase [Acetobacter sp. CAG:977]